MVVAVVLIAGGSRFLGAKASALLHFGAGSSVSQRYGYWSAALRLAGHHPLVGTGPDTFAVTYTRYQDAALAKTLGTSFFVNGAHNIFLSWLANEGIPGMILIIALLVFALAWGWRAWRSLRPSPRPRRAATWPMIPIRNGVCVVVALIAGLVAYFVQACFDVEQVATLFTLFMVLGLLGTANRGLFPVASLIRLPFPPAGRALRIRSPGGRGRRRLPAPCRRRSGAYRTFGAAHRQSDARRLVSTLVAGAIGLTAVGLSFWRTDALWRADHQERVSTQSSLENATNLNPWEPSYFGALGKRRPPPTSTTRRRPTPSPSSRRPSASCARTSPSTATTPTPRPTTATPSRPWPGPRTATRRALRQALAALERARMDDPFNPRVAPLIKTVKKALQD